MTTEDEETPTGFAVEISTCGRPDCVPCKIRTFLTLMKALAADDSDKGGKYPYGASLFALMAAGKVATVIAGQSLRKLHKGDVEKAITAVAEADREAGRLAMDLAYSAAQEGEAPSAGGCYPAGHA